MEETNHTTIGLSVIAKKRRREEAASKLPHDENNSAIIGKRKTLNITDFWNPIIVNEATDTVELQDERAPKKKKHKHKGKTGTKPNKHKKENKKNKKQKKKENKRKKSKKISEKAETELVGLKDEILDNKDENISSVAGAMLVLKEHLCSFNGTIYLYSKKLGSFKALQEKDVEVRLMELFTQNERLRIWSKDMQNAYKQLLINPDIQQDLSPKVNIPLVNCENGVLDLETMTLLKHSPKYGFTSCIQASYDDEAAGKYFKQFLSDITSDDKSLKKLLQECIGYALSNYVWAKKAFIIIGVPNSGKSVLLCVTERMVGEDNICHVDLQKLSDPKYAARLNECCLNIAPDLPQTPIKDIGTFKSLVSSLDKIESRKLYKDPVSQPCYCKLLFGTNQFVPLNKLDANNAEAFFERLIIIPFLYAKPAEERDLNLAEKLWEDRDYIFTWAMKGLKRLINNNFIFSSSKESDRILEQYKTKYCPEVTFFDKHLQIEDGSIISRDEVQKEYEKFAKDRGVHVGSYDMKNFITLNYPLIKQSRKRLHGCKNPIAVYEGLNFKK